MPKSSKTLRRGWNRRYAQLRDLQIWLFESEVDPAAPLDAGDMIVDMRKDVLQVKATNPAEMANVTRDAFLIFEMKISSGGGASVSTVTAPPSETDMRTKITKLLRDIQQEEHIVHGIENMVKAASGATRRSAEEQLAGSNKKLSELRHELDKCQRDEPALVKDVRESYQTEESVQQLRMLEEKLAKESKIKEAVQAQLSQLLQKRKQSRSDKEFVDKLQKDYASSAKTVASLSTEVDKMKKVTCR